jgi:hypothetical protein
VENVSILSDDTLFLTNTASIIELSADNLSQVLTGLAQLVADSSQDQAELPSPHTLQSQLYAMKVISLCLAYFWRNPRRPLARDRDRLAFLSQPTPMTAHTPIGTGKILVDPAPLDEQLSRYVSIWLMVCIRLLLSVVSRYFCTTLTTLNPDTASHSTFANFMAFQTFTDFQGLGCLYNC